MNEKITRAEMRYLIYLLDAQIYELCSRLEPNRSSYQPGVEENLELAVSIREKLIRRLPDQAKPLQQVMGNTQPTFRNPALAEKFQAVPLS
jgi:hypothetical protein